MASQKKHIRRVRHCSILYEGRRYTSLDLAPFERDLVEVFEPIDPDPQELLVQVGSRAVWIPSNSLLLRRIGGQDFLDRILEYKNRLFCTPPASGI